MKKRVEKLETEATPIWTPEALEIDRLLREGREFIEHPERFPPEDPEETRAMLKELLASYHHERKMEARGKA